MGNGEILKLSIAHTKHTAYLGKKGVGKDTLAQDDIRDLREEGFNEVYTNVTMYEPHNSHSWDALHTEDCRQHIPEWVHQIKYLRAIKQAKKAVVYISELSKAIPSRRVGHQQTEIYNLIQDTMNRLRKRNCPFGYSDQWRRGADIMIRTNVDYVKLPILTRDIAIAGDSKLPYMVFAPKGQDFVEMETPNSEMTYMSSHRTVKELFGMFRTEEVIPLTYNPPFKVDSWTNTFCRWCEKKGYLIIGMKDGTIRNVLDLYMIKTNKYIQTKEQSAVIGKLKLEGKIGATL